MVEVLCFLKNCCIHRPKRIEAVRGVPTLRISVSGEPQNLFGNLKILPGIREPREIIRETTNNIGILHNIFGACI